MNLLDDNSREIWFRIVDLMDQNWFITVLQQIIVDSHDLTSLWLISERIKHLRNSFN